MRAELATLGGVNGFTDKSHAGIHTQVFVSLREGEKGRVRGMCPLPAEDANSSHPFPQEHS